MLLIPVLSPKASSPEALEDFATIQTQQDVNNFNMKYDVELILPAEA